jgi:uncharacterized protein (UPF0332 family)
MNDEDQRHMRKALRLLQSVERRAESDQPETVVSTAYYAMFHAACAVVLQHQHRLPKTHSSLIGQFGLLVRDRGAEDREFGSMLHEAFNLRFVGDYSIEEEIGRTNATDARDHARAFIAYCRKLKREAKRSASPK